MKINIALLECSYGINTEINALLADNEYNLINYNHIDKIDKDKSQVKLIICPFHYFNEQIRLSKKLIYLPYLLITENNEYLTNEHSYIFDCLKTPFTKNELEFRINNLLQFTQNQQKLKLFYEKNRKKTIDLFGKHIDLKKAQKEIKSKNNKLVKTIEKKNVKTVELFGKHIDLKKAQKEILKQKKLSEIQKTKLEEYIEKKKRKTIDLFGKHIDLKKAKKELQEKNELLTKVLDKNRQKTIELFGKHIDLKKAKKEISLQKAHIEKQNNSITDSIKYASFIQSAVFPREERIREILPKHMILYLPRDIVSGDFYWLEKLDDKLYIAAADCTGHGVPGAFMSMLGIALLNELINRYKHKKANEILDLLRDKIIYSLHQTGRMDEAADGLDISFCIINMNNLEMQFAGAHNPVYIIRNNELIEIKGDRMPIGFSLRVNKPFTNNIFQIEKNDKIYIFSDGFADQFGGENGMKMRYKQFQQYLLEVHALDFDKQKVFLMNKFIEWKGNNMQIDDILVLGFEV